MNGTTEHVHSTPDPTTSETTVARSPLMPRISWGAIFAGVVVAMGLAWLLNLLGAAIGVSIQDASDTVAISDGLQGGAAVWLVLSWLIAFFVGSLVAARLAGYIDDVSGMLHGLTLWGLGTIVFVWLSYSGMSSMLETGGRLVSATASGVGQVASGVGSATYSGATNVATGASQLMDTAVVDTIRNQLSDVAIESAADMQDQLSEPEIRQIISDIDERTVRRLTQDLINDDQDGAAELLASSTELSEQDAEALISSAYRQLEEQFGNPENNQSLAQDLKSQLGEQVDSYIADLDARGGVEVTSRDVRTAIDRLDREAMNAIAMRLMNGDTRGAKRVLANNTNLTNEQIEAIYDGAQEGIMEEVDAYTAEVNDAMEVVSNYTQAVLWVVFSASALALAVSLCGGWLGADASKKYYTRVHRTYTS